MICAAASRIELAASAMAFANAGSRGLRCASLSDSGVYGSPLRWNAKTFSVPSSRNNPAMPLRTPTSTVATSTTVTMPITTPAMASAERSVWLRSESIASMPASRASPASQVTPATPLLTRAAITSIRVARRAG